VKSQINKIKDKVQQAKIAAGILDQTIYTGPWQVQIDLTNRCNNNCLACWCNSPLLGEAAMDPGTKAKTLAFETVVDLIDELEGMGVRNIYLTGGGEPFMHPRILDIMRHVKKRQMHLGMSTNFTLVDKKIAAHLVDIGIDQMNLSLWAATPATYKKLHPNKDYTTFSKIEAMIDHIYQLKRQKKTAYPRLEMYNVINIYNYHELQSMLEFAFQHRMDGVTFAPIDTIQGKTDGLVLSAKDKSALLDSLKQIPELTALFGDKYQHTLRINNFKTFMKRIKNFNKGIYDKEILESMPSCYAGWSFARILANGEVNSCLKSFKTPVGSIYEKSFAEIWMGAKQNKFRKYTINYAPNDPFLKNMGNTRFANNHGCIKCCDNLGLNISIHEKMMALGSYTQKALKMVRFFKGNC